MIKMNVASQPFLVFKGFSYLSFKASTSLSYKTKYIKFTRIAQNITQKQVQPQQWLVLIRIFTYILQQQNNTITHFYFTVTLYYKGRQPELPHSHNTNKAVTTACNLYLQDLSSRFLLVPRLEDRLEIPGGTKVQQEASCASSESMTRAGRLLQDYHNAARSVTCSLELILLWLDCFLKT